MLGGADGECPPPHSPFYDPVVFMGDARDNPGSVHFTVILRTRRLLPCAYPEAQLPLSDRVLAMKDGQGMTFKAIAEALALEGWKGARGAVLTDRGVFSVYKKRKAHDLRRSAPVLWWIRKIVVYPPADQRTKTV